MAQSYARRDHLVSIEKEAQALWDNRKTNEVDATTDGTDKEKYFCTFPYPYMNGRLHLGHAFTITKAEFQARFQRTLGKKVLWPFAFHCTGMPIAAAADKIKLILNKKKEETVVEETDKRSQWDIMKSMDVPEDEIHLFADPLHWLRYFPPYAIGDLKNFGLAIDWRRSFITTEVNPYYDKFIRWQFRKLRKANKIKFGARLAIFSRFDGQPCSDHDRASGENVCPQEYTCVKLRILDPVTPSLLRYKESIKGRVVFILVATLRPETMYGQTNCFALPTGKYSGYVSTCDKEVYICSSHAALNLGCQGFLTMAVPDTDIKLNTHGEPITMPLKLFDVMGKDLLGVSLNAPNCIYDKIYMLPMMSISMTKGTGLVTSVPSDSPDDYATLRDLKEKKGLREKFGIEEHMVAFEPIEIIETPGFGSLAAVKACKDRNIVSQNDSEKLTLAKADVYLKSFYEGIMLIGEFKGKFVYEAKPLCRNQLINNGDAMSYAEPERPVVARSGETCVVALCDQWFLTYGEEQWRDDVIKHVQSDTFNAYTTAALHGFEHTLGWLKEWGCSRNYGLGTKLPWDDSVVIESLSDSTIYMAFYTIAHLLQGDVRGETTGLSGITSDQLCDDCFDYIYNLTDTPPTSETCPSVSQLDRLRDEFLFWYPMDLRVSGKDLIPNHLTMSLYNHSAIWNYDNNENVKNKKNMMPLSFYSNGHIMVDAKKMSKQEGNFLTLSDSVSTYGADATRLTCADAGDTLDDANFSRESANSAVMKLFLLEQFVKQNIENSNNLRTGEYTEGDIMFNNEIARLVNEAKTGYTKLLYREALRACFFDFGTVRDQYRLHCGDTFMHLDCVNKWIECQILTLCPICPHICEHLWQNVLKRDGLCVEALWPDLPPHDELLHRQRTLLFSFASELRDGKTKVQNKKGAKGKGGVDVDNKTNIPDTCVVYVATSYNDIQKVALTELNKINFDENLTPPNDYLSTIKNSDQVKACTPDLVKNVLQFAAHQVKQMQTRGKSALDLSLPFDELKLLQDHKEFISRTVPIQSMSMCVCVYV
eukprot:GHVR01190828.1.p1 GENE.GHVR01190828.1~~GHVR01190828.1.p1  ORF type:complete len:1046 (+),score=250.39 GHVR01190828.1:149-3286(+)